MSFTMNATARQAKAPHGAGAFLGIPPQPPVASVGNYEKAGLAQLLQDAETKLDDYRDEDRVACEIADRCGSMLVWLGKAGVLRK